jgi:hypothetical protein
MAEGKGTLSFIVWLIISALTIASLLITIRNGLGPDDAVVGAAAGGSFWMTIKSFFSGTSYSPAPKYRIVYPRSKKIPYSLGLWWRK